MATKNENPAPFMAVHPGMMIKPELEERGISQKEFAKMVGTQASHLSEVLNGKRPLTTDLAVKIESAIGLPAKVLLNEQEARLPIHTDCAPYYHWRDFRRHYLKKIDNFEKKHK